jgi:hypothetical protein
MSKVGEDFTNKLSPGNETITGKTARGESCDLPPLSSQPNLPSVEGGRFETWSLADFAGQCRMQSSDNLDPEYSAFMSALVKRLSGLAAAQTLDQTMIDRVAAAIESADFGYSMRQIRLVDGINTYALAINGMPTEEFTDNGEYSASDQCYARIREVKQRAQAEAVIAAIVPPTPSSRAEGDAP